MRLQESVKDKTREELLRVYDRIVDGPKNVLGLSKNKILKKILEVYEDFNNIISLCTLRELKFLEMCVSEDVSSDIKEFDFEVRNLIDKFLIVRDKEFFVVPEEIVSSVKMATIRYDEEKVKKNDRINETLVSFVKVQGFKETYIVINACNVILNLSEDELLDHVFNNLCFKYYVDLINKKGNGVQDKIWYFVYRDYSDLVETIEFERDNHHVLNMGAPVYEKYKSIFYNDFDFTNSHVKKFYDELCSLGDDKSRVVKEILKSVMIDDDREKLRDLFKVIPSDFFEVMNKAMDEMPSGVLNGLSVNELKKFKEDKFKKNYIKSKSYTGQVNACLDYEDSCLFCKLYYGVLEFTNIKYKIKPMYKIFGKNHSQSMDLSLIAEAFYNNKEAIIDEFCMVNPFGFSDDEIELVCEFKRSVRSIFLLMDYLEDYTAFMSPVKVYMVKGVSKNLDEVIPFNDLPTAIYANIVPFKGKIVFDGVAVQIEMNAGYGFDEILDSVYNNLEKCYYL